MDKTQKHFLNLAKRAAYIADSKKARDPIVLNVRSLTSETDYIVIATAESAPQVSAIINTITKTFREDENTKPIHRDGVGSSEWTVVDYGGIIIHIMSPIHRELYALEKLWHEARKIRWHE